MAKVVAPIRCRVKAIGKPKQSAYGDGCYYPVLFVDLAALPGVDSGEIWKNLTGDEVSQIMKGDIVDLVPAGESRSGKPRHNIVLVQEVEPASDSAPSPAPEVKQSAPEVTSAGLTPEQKRAIASYIDSRADLYRYTYQAVKQRLDGLVTAESVLNEVSSLLFLSAVRTFDLEQTP